MAARAARACTTRSRPSPLIPDVGLHADPRRLELHPVGHVHGRNGPDARAIVTYSQSTDPANPNYADMTKLFSDYGWVTLPFAEGDIRRDPNLKVLRLSERN